MSPEVAPEQATLLPVNLDVRDAGLRPVQEVTGLIVGHEQRFDAGAQRRVGAAHPVDIRRLLFARGIFQRRAEKRHRVTLGAWST